MQSLFLLAELLAHSIEIYPPMAHSIPWRACDFWVFHVQSEFLIPCCSQKPGPLALLNAELYVPFDELLLILQVPLPVSPRL